jgi:hypothetical protein
LAYYWLGDVVSNDEVNIIEQESTELNIVNNAYVIPRVGNASKEARTDRLRKVGDLLSIGMTAAQIAIELDVDIRTVTTDIDAWRILFKQPTDIESLRKSQTLKMLEIQEAARDRYINDGIPVEGRLAIDASARIGKMHGLDETEAVTAIGGALAGLLASLSSSDEE